MPRGRKSPEFVIASENSLMDKYAFAAKELRIPAIETFLEETKVELEVRAKKWMECYKSPNEIITGQPRERKMPKVVFDVDRSGILFSSVQCFLCNKTVRTGVTKCRTRSGLRCVFHRGNFNKHMSTHHKEYVLEKDSN